MEFKEKVERIMIERFGRNNVIALATLNAQMPFVRFVNGYYEDGAFYVITHGLSSKMKQIEKNPVVAVSGEWFTGHGKGKNLGYFGKKENKVIAEKLKKVFAEWIDNGHNDFSDNNTCILCIQLIDGILLSHGTPYEIYWSKNGSVKRITNGKTQETWDQFLCIGVDHCEGGWIARLNGAPMMSKKEEQGVKERIQVLRQYRAELTENMVKGWARELKCESHDVLDAVCLAVTAYMNTDGKAESIPGKPAKDIKGLEMQMVIPKEMVQ